MERLLDRCDKRRVSALITGDRPASRPAGYILMRAVAGMRAIDASGFTAEGVAAPAGWLAAGQAMSSPVALLAVTDAPSCFSWEIGRWGDRPSIIHYWLLTTG
jgi:hypothetical protein